MLFSYITCKIIWIFTFKIITMNEDLCIFVFKLHSKIRVQLLVCLKYSWLMHRHGTYGMIWYLFNRNWVDTRWQHHTTHLQQTIHTIHREYNSGSAGRAPSLRVIPWHLAYNWGKSTEKTSVRVAQYKNNEQAQRTNTIQEQQQAPHKDWSTIQEHEPSQYKNNEQAPEPWNTIP